MPEEKREPFHWQSAIAYKTLDRLVVRGYDVNELTGNVSFAQMIYLIFKGELPSKGQASMIDALLVTSAEHGFSPSAVAARMVAAGRSPLNAAMAAGMLGYGEAHGPVHTAARLLQDYLKKGKLENKNLAEIAQLIVKENRRVTGLNQPQHANGDPRVTRLFALAREYGVYGEHSALLNLVEVATERAYGSRKYVNLSGAAGAVLSDIGFTPDEAWAVILAGHSIGCAAHAIEEVSREKAWRASSENLSVSLFDLELQGNGHYDGPADRKLPPKA
jgi:citrate synthase